MKHTAGERERKRAEGMLRICGDLIDLDTSILTIKIHKHVSDHFSLLAELLLARTVAWNAHMLLYVTFLYFIETTSKVSLLARK